MDEVKNILVIGHSGAGKSLLSAILTDDYDTYTISNDVERQRVHDQTYKFTCSNKNVKFNVYDWDGESTTQAFEKAIKSFNKKLHAILFVMMNGRMGLYERDFMKEIIGILMKRHGGSERRMILTITRSPSKLIRSEAKAKEFIDEEKIKTNSPFQYFVNLHDGNDRRIIFMNNKNPAEEEDDVNVSNREIARTVFDKIRELPGGQEEVKSTFRLIGNKKKMFIILFIIVIVIGIGILGYLIPTTYTPLPTTTTTTTLPSIGPEYEDLDSTDLEQGNYSNSANDLGANEPNTDDPHHIYPDNHEHQSDNSEYEHFTPKGPDQNYHHLENPMNLSNSSHPGHPNFEDPNTEDPKTENPNYEDTNLEGLFSVSSKHEDADLGQRNTSNPSNEQNNGDPDSKGIEPYHQHPEDYVHPSNDLDPKHQNPKGPSPNYDNTEKSIDLSNNSHPGGQNPIGSDPRYHKPENHTALSINSGSEHSPLEDLDPNYPHPEYSTDPLNDTDLEHPDPEKLVP